jgi:hypothetical protein
VLGLRRVLLGIACPFHAWNWPRLAKGNLPEGFDAHQTCFKCNVERLYSTTRLEAGPLYRTLVPRGRENPLRRLAELLRSADSNFVRTLDRAVRLARATFNEVASLRASAVRLTPPAPVPISSARSRVQTSFGNK